MNTTPPRHVAAEPYAWPYNGDLRPGNTALIVIDMQTDFCGKGGYVDVMGYDLSLVQAPIQPIARMLAALRPLGFHVIHTREGHRPDLVREARATWGVENNIDQLYHRGYVAVKGGAQDCPYTYMHDMAAGTYKLPWSADVKVTDGSSCGFAAPERTYEGNKR